MWASWSQTWFLVSSPNGWCFLGSWGGLAIPLLECVQPRNEHRSYIFLHDATIPVQHPMQNCFFELELCSHVVCNFGLNKLICKTRTPTRTLSGERTQNKHHVVPSAFAIQCFFPILKHVACCGLCHCYSVMSRPIVFLCHLVLLNILLLLLLSSFFISIEQSISTAFTHCLCLRIRR